MQDKKCTLQFQGLLAKRIKQSYNATLHRLLRNREKVFSDFHLQLPQANPLKCSMLIFRKYYGKKISNLNCSDKPSFFYSPNNYSAQQTFSFPTLNRSKQLPKTLKSLEVSYSTSFCQRKENKILSSTIAKYKHLKNFKLTRQKPEPFIKLTPLNKNIRKLNHLQSLTLNILESFLIRDASIIPSIKSLQSISITVMPVTKYDDENLDTVQFYVSLFRLKNLKFLELDFLKSAHKSTTFAEQILQELCQTAIPAFNISLKTACIQLSTVLRIDNAVSKVDLVTFRSYNVPSVSCTCNTSNYKTHAKRKMHVDIISPSSVELEKLKNKYSFDLEIKTVNPKTKYQLKYNSKRLFDTPLQEPLQILSKIKDITRLRSLSVNFGSIERNKLEAIIDALIEILKNENALIHLSLNSIILLKKAKLESDIYKALFNQISQLQFLQSLELQKFEFDCDFANRVTRPLLSLSNLRKLRLDLRVFGPPESGVDFDITFPDSCKLVELDIKLIPMTLESCRNFIDAISKLECLQKLNISDGYGLTMEECRTALIKTLLGLKELKEVAIKYT